MASSDESSKFHLSKRWTADLVEDGFTPVSIFFLENYSKLSPSITHSEAMLIIHLIRYKWTENAPYPGFKTIAAQMGISPQMARHHARSLEQKKYLTRFFQIGATNKFILAPLFAALTQLRKTVIARGVAVAERLNEQTAAQDATLPKPSVKPPLPKPSVKPPLPPKKKLPPPPPPSKPTVLQRGVRSAKK